MNKLLEINHCRKQFGSTEVLTDLTLSVEEGQVLCARKGIIQPLEGGKCFWFRYDPCKRIPCKAKALDFSKYDEEDFSL